MSFWDHLEELRWTLFRSILALFVFAIGSFAFMRDLFDHVIMAPCYADPISSSIGKCVRLVLIFLFSRTFVMILSM